MCRIQRHLVLQLLTATPLSHPLVLSLMEKLWWPRNTRKALSTVLLFICLFVVTEETPLNQIKSEDATRPINRRRHEVNKTKTRQKSEIKKVFFFSVLVCFHHFIQMSDAYDEPKETKQSIKVVQHYCCMLLTSDLQAASHQYSALQGRLLV